MGKRMYKFKLSLTSSNILPEMLDRIDFLGPSAGGFEHLRQPFQYYDQRSSKSVEI